MQRSARAVLITWLVVAAPTIALAQPSREIVPAMSGSADAIAWSPSGFAIGRILERRPFGSYQSLDTFTFWIEVHDAPPASEGAEPRLRWQVPGRVTAVVFHPDGVRLATAVDQTVELRDARTGAILSRIPQGQPVAVIGFSADGTRLAIGTTDGRIQVITIADGHVERTHAMTGSTPGVIRRYTGEGAYHDNIPTEYQTEPVALAFSPDGGSLAVAGSEGTVRIFPSGGGAPRLLVPPNPPALYTQVNARAPLALRWDRTSRRLSVAYGDASILEWTVANARRRELRAAGCTPAELAVTWHTLHQGPPTPEALAQCGQVMKAAWAPDGALVLMVQSLGGALVSNGVTGAPIVSFTTLHQQSIAFAPTGDRVALGAIGGTIQVMDPRAGTLQGYGQVASVAQLGEQALDLSSDRRFLVVRGGREDSVRYDLSPQQWIRVWDLARGVPIPGPSGDGYLVGLVGPRLVRVTPDRRVEVWTLDPPARTAVLGPFPENEQTFAVSADGATLFSAGASALRVHRIADGRVLRTIAVGCDPIEKLQVSRDGRRALTLCYPGGASLWDTTTGRRITHVAQGQRAIALSADGRSFAAGIDTSVLAWFDDVHAAPHHRLTTAGPLQGAAFSADGRRLLVSGNLGAPIMRWDGSRTETLDVSVLAADAMFETGGLIHVNDRGHGLHLLRARDGRLLASIRATTEGGYLVHSRDGHFDAPTDTARGALLIFDRPRDPTDPRLAIPWRTVWPRLHTPGLLGTLVTR